MAASSIACGQGVPSRRPSLRKQRNPPTRLGLGLHTGDPPKKQPQTPMGLQPPNQQTAQRHQTALPLAQSLPTPRFRRSLKQEGGQAGRRWLGFRVPNNTYGSPRRSAPQSSGVLPFLGVVEAGHLPGSVTLVGDTRGYGSCRSFPPTRSVRVRSRCRRFVRCVMCRLWPGRWRRSSPAVIWLLRLVVLTARPSVLLSKLWVVIVRSPTWTRAGWRPFSRSCGRVGRRRLGTPEGWQCGRSPPGVVSVGL